MKRFLLLFAALMLPFCALAVTSIPEGVTVVESEAFAGTGIDGLIIPSSVKTVGADVLAGCNASYIYLKGASTTLETGANNGVPFVFGPENSPASDLEGFCDSATLVNDGGLYYSVEAEAIPLCAKEPAALSGSVTIPKLLNGVPVTNLDALHLANTGVTELRVPQYLPIPSGLDATPYQTIFVTEPVPSVDEIPAGQYMTWTTTSAGAYGDVSYLWTFEVGGEISSAITAEPTVRFAPMAEGECVAAVTVEDALGDTATAESAQSLTVTESVTVYRALLIGNTYPGPNPLLGPDNDVAAMKTMLSAMSGTPYQITTAYNLTSNGIQSAIATAFGDAQPSDVSLFFYGGHGEYDGTLLGVGDTRLTIFKLRAALQKIPGTKIVLLDCCYSGNAIGRSASADAGAFNRAVISAFSAAPRSADNLAEVDYLVITACRKDQLAMSLTGDGSRYWGVFTYGLCYGSGYDEWNQKALSNLPADANGNGAITLREAYNGARERVTYLNRYAAVTQEIQYYGDGNYVLWSR